MRACTLEDEYKIEFVGGDTLPNIHISGPPDEIAMLQTNKVKPTAMMTFTRDDGLTGGGRRAPVFVGLPEHVTVAPVDKAREVEFRLTKRGTTRVTYHGLPGRGP